MNFFRTCIRLSRKGVLLAGMSLLFLLTPAITQGQNLTTQKIKLNVTNASLETVFAEIEKQSGMNFFFGEEIDKYASKRVTIATGSISVEDAIAQALWGK